MVIGALGLRKLAGMLREVHGAIKRQAEALAERLPEVRVEYVPSGATSFKH